MKSLERRDNPRTIPAVDMDFGQKDLQGQLGLSFLPSWLPQHARAP
ncbi:MAG TPA: hypothetical protein PLJ27_09215 [Polyangiaceae bacterium]|nr:hypothetical protein [Polyangiaceae bacterium]HOT12380.1 hypothetical protein [Polyangiaceae bacterium]HPB94658.1 hypothetical protein [Polyangiaceae bacterium]HPY20638.1 hypothetical protein [Polyangiaceae bacterium]HQK17623.1 hypothetical protein [Polyangiaceae bacterium]